MEGLEWRIDAETMPYPRNRIVRPGCLKLPYPKPTERSISYGNETAAKGSGYGLCQRVFRLASSQGGPPLFRKAVLLQPALRFFWDCHLYPATLQAWIDVPLPKMRSITQSNQLTDLPTTEFALFTQPSEQDQYSWGDGWGTLRSSNGWLKWNGQYTSATLVKLATDEWYPSESTRPKKRV